MSVRVIDRGESKLEVLIRAKELCQYTLHIAKNEKVFPKRDRWLLTKPIVDYTIFIYTSLMEANEIKVETHDDYVRRRNLQKLALEKCAPLLSLMQIAYENISALDGRRVEHWTGLVIKLKE